MAAPWQWGIEVSDLHHLSKPVGLSSMPAPSLCCGAAALAQTGQTPSPPHVQRQARVTGLLRQASPRIVHHHPARPRTQQSSSEESTSYAAAALKPSSHTGLQRPEKPPPLQEDKRVAKARPRPPTQPGQGRQNRSAQRCPARFGPSRGGPSREGGADSGGRPQRWGGAAPGL